MCYLCGTPEFPLHVLSWPSSRRAKWQRTSCSARINRATRMERGRSSGETPERRRRMQLMRASLQTPREGRLGAPRGSSRGALPADSPGTGPTTAPRGKTSSSSSSCSSSGPEHPLRGRMPMGVLSRHSNTRRRTGIRRAAFHQAAAAAPRGTATCAGFGATSRRPVRTRTATATRSIDPRGAAAAAAAFPDAGGSLQTGSSSPSIGGIHHEDP